MSSNATDAPTLDPAVDAAIDRALTDGRIEDAAALLERAGRLEEAAARYAEVWRFQQAVALARAASLPLRALGYALDSQDEALVQRAVSGFDDWPAAAAQGAELARDRHRPGVAARLFERACEFTRAAECFEQAGEMGAAGRSLEQAGEPQKAGRCYERCLRGDPKDSDAALALARILCRFGRFEPAARALQGVVAAREPAAWPGQADCLSLLVACLDAMAAPEAAAEALTSLRRVDASAPTRVSDLLAQVYGSPSGLRARATEGREELLGGRYHVRGELGEGASGRVLLADDIFHARRVAVKVLRVDGGLGGRDALARFLREARIAASIDDTHVVRVYEADASGPFLVMEYMAGGTLEARLVEAEAQGRTLPGRELRSILTALLAGLEAVHRRGIVHRDLKPQNVFFDAAGELKLGDFGVAHLADRGATATGAMLGTLAYMAPEQVALSADPTAATDLYAFGVMLFRMLTGSLPFGGSEIALAQLDLEAPSPSTRCPALGTAFDACLARFLAKDPGARPQSAEDARALLAPLAFPVDGVPFSQVEVSDGRALRKDSNRPLPPDERYQRASDVRAPDRALDRVLRRSVTLLALRPGLAERLQAFARADSPFLQAVYSLDRDAGHAVLEAPKGEPLANIPTPQWPTRQVREALSMALERIHAEGIAHGALDAHHVLVGAGRCLLLLGVDEGEGTPEQDRRALAELLD